MSSVLVHDASSPERALKEFEPSSRGSSAPLSSSEGATLLVRRHRVEVEEPRSDSHSKRPAARSSTLQMLISVFSPFPNSWGQLRRRIRRFVAHMIATYAFVGDNLLRCVSFLGLATVEADELFTPGGLGAEDFNDLERMY